MHEQLEQLHRMCAATAEPNVRVALCCAVGAVVGASVGRWLGGHVGHVGATTWACNAGRPCGATTWGRPDSVAVRGGRPCGVRWGDDGGVQAGDDGGSPRQHLSFILQIGEIVPQGAMHKDISAADFA